MKARYLKKLLKTKFFVYQEDGYILIHGGTAKTLILLNIRTLKLSHPFDRSYAQKKGKRWFLEIKIKRHRDKLISIWDKLHELIVSGEILDIINGKDIIKNPTTFYEVKNGKLVSIFTEKDIPVFLDDNGTLLNANNYYRSEIDALKGGINKEKAEQIENNEKVTSLSKELYKTVKAVNLNEKKISELENLLKLKENKSDTK